MIKRAYYDDEIKTFLIEKPEKILGELVRNHNFDLDTTQTDAWLEQISNLQLQLVDFQFGHIFLEFSIPRMGKRVDVLLLIHGMILVLEYKAGADRHNLHAVNQVMDYALDLKNFHDGSHNKYVIPILVSTKASRETNWVRWSDDRVTPTLLSNGSDLGEIVKQVLSDIPVQPSLDAEQWATSGYKPTPTIVEAAQALYRGHSVEEISRSDAGVVNLTKTAGCIGEIIDHSKKYRRKSICFVTGVPGAGKTLAGLNLAATKLHSDDGHAVFLSGNGPLVNVLREALARDEVNRAKEAGVPLSKTKAHSRVSAFIQNIHHFRDEHLKVDVVPPEHVVVFDEAQRAWNQEHAEKFMSQKRRVSNFGMSEPEFLISVMDRREDWCTIVCLIGGGQEINIGEAGLTEWFEALRKRFLHWDVYYPQQMTEGVYTWGRDLVSQLASLKVHRMDALHLGVSVRSFRAEELSDFVASIIQGELDSAQRSYRAISAAYPIVLTREIDCARRWLRQKARGSERYGLVASAGAIRLKPEGIYVKNAIDPARWFLNEKDDIRSSYYLEDPATEFDIQGLELDWTGVCWDADFRRENGVWSLYSFKGTKWQQVRDEFRRVYLANAYRVLLTRARQGMVIFVPKGDERDYTRPPWFYDETYNFLTSAGMKEI